MYFILYISKHFAEKSSIGLQDYQNIHDPGPGGLGGGEKKGQRIPIDGNKMA